MVIEQWLLNNFWSLCFRELHGKRNYTTTNLYGFCLINIKLNNAVVSQHQRSKFREIVFKVVIKPNCIVFQNCMASTY